MLSAVSTIAASKLELLQIRIHDSNIFGLIGVSTIEKASRTPAESRAPQIPYQKTAFSTLTEYCLRIFSS